MKRLFLNIRTRFHPLFYLRKLRAFQLLTRYADIPVPIRFPHVPHRVYVSLTKNLSWVLTNGESCEESERANFVSLVTKGGFKHFVDVGANIGLYGFLFGALRPTGNVLMVEPDSSNASLIRRTIEKHGLPVELIEAAVSDQAGEITFHVDNLTGATGSIESVAFIATHHGQTPKPVTIHAITLDETLRHDPDLIKIDVEGAELKVFRGATALLSRAQPALFFECDQKKAEVSEFLKGFGYQFFDFVSLRPTANVVHNTLALHPVRHSDILLSIAKSA